MTAGVDHVAERHSLAAMEPAEYRPDDVKTGQRRSCGQRAAMEPAEYRPDDAPRGASSALSWNGPQWSRPSIGRMTGELYPRKEDRCPPQWSRPSIGRMTSPGSCGCGAGSGRNGAGRVSAG